ncbi:MAG: chemotaxis protein CheX [Bryobacteraceae bacterium]
MSEHLSPNDLASIIGSATKDVFSTMLNISVEAEEFQVDLSTPPSFDGVIALVGIAGAWHGSGRISMTSQCAIRLAGGLLSTEYNAVDEDVLDAVAEVANMVIGNVKAVLEDRLGALGLSVPTVIYGRNYQARSLGVTEWVVVPFQCEAERLEVRFCMMPAASLMHGRPEMMHV